MIRKSPYSLGSFRPCMFGIRNHICKYNNNLYKISEVIYNISELAKECNFTFNQIYIVSFIKDFTIIYSNDINEEIDNIHINKNEHIIDNYTIYISKDYMFSIDYIQEYIQGKLISALLTLLQEDKNINNKESYLYNLLYRNDIEFKHICNPLYHVDILNILGNLLNYICIDSDIFRDYLYGSKNYIHKKYNDIDNIRMLRGKYTYHDIKKMMDDEVANRIKSIQHKYKGIYSFINQIIEYPYYIICINDEFKDIFKIIYNAETVQEFIGNIKNRIDIFLNETLQYIPNKEYQKSNLKKLVDKFEYKKVEYYG